MVGWFRFPGSYNTSSGTYGRVEINHDSIYDTHELYNSMPKIAQKHTSKYTQKHTGIYELQNLYTLSRERIRQMEKLQSLRYMQHKGSRDLMIFVVYNSLICAGATETEAMQTVSKLNMKFRHPLKERTLRQYTNSARKKGGYPISNTWIIENLCISEVEQAELGLFERGETWKPIKERTPNFTRDLQRKERKQKRNEDILRYASYGRTDKEIAQEVGCSEKTVRTIRKGTINKKMERQKRIQELKASGRTQKEVSEIMEIGIATVKRQWNI